MDEPAAGMAPTERGALMALAARIARERTIGVLFTEHDMDAVFGHADRILVLNRGALIAEGAPADVRANREVQEVYLGAGALYEAPHDRRRRQACGHGLNAAYGRAHILYDVALKSARAKRSRCSAATAPANRRPFAPSSASSPIAAATSSSTARPFAICHL